MSATSTQDYLFQRIREFLPINNSLADTVSAILNVSSDSAYRRIRGETPLVVDEAALLCAHFGISLDLLFKAGTEHTLFNTRRISMKDYSFETYLGEILVQLKQMNEAKEKEIFYLSKDLPFFYNFSSGPLFAFHYFFWMKSIFHNPADLTRAFDPNNVPAGVRELGNAILETYTLIPSTEICNTECINSIISQVEYYRDAGYFSSASDIRTIYESMQEMINYMKDQAEHGVKFLPGKNPELSQAEYCFFYNRITLGDNTIITQANNKKTVYLNYDVMNYMSTRDEQFCNETFERIKTLMKRSTLLSGTSEKQRNIFFNILLEKISERKKHL